MIRTIHRSVMIVAVLFLLYVGITGSITQSIDIKTLLAHAPASDATMQAIRDGIYGPPNFYVLENEDFAAADFPASYNTKAGLGTVLDAARKSVGVAALDFIELRMGAQGPIGRVQSLGRTQTFDALNGALLRTEAAKPIGFPDRPDSLRDHVKTWHRMVVFGTITPWVELATTILLAIMVISGLGLIINGRKNPFSSRGERWRWLHRSVAVVASAFLLVVAASGAFLAIETISGQAYLASLGMQLPGLNGANPLMSSAASPLVDAKLPNMLATTLAATARDAEGTPIKIVRLRNYAGMAQGVVIAGGDESRQLVFNAATGATASSYEKGYPKTPFPFGWHYHEVVKRIHRGDIFGLTGRWMDLLTGLSLVFLATTGLIVYFKAWSQRRRLGRSGLFWT